jgi:hypothetical protein
MKAAFRVRAAFSLSKWAGGCGFSRNIHGKRFFRESYVNIVDFSRIFHENGLFREFCVNRAGARQCTANLYLLILQRDLIAAEQFLRVRVVDG